MNRKSWFVCGVVLIAIVGFALVVVMNDLIPFRYRVGETMSFKIDKGHIDLVVVKAGMVEYEFKGTMEQKLLAVNFECQWTRNVKGIIRNDGSCAIYLMDGMQEIHFTNGDVEISPSPFPHFWVVGRIDGETLRM